MGLRLVQIGPKQAICFSRFLSDLVHQQGPLGVLTALLRPHRGRVQTSTALLRHCRGRPTGPAGSAHCAVAATPRARSN